MSPGWGWEGGPLEGALTRSLWPGPQLALLRPAPPDKTLQARSKAHLSWACHASAWSPGEGRRPPSGRQRQVRPLGAALPAPEANGAVETPTAGLLATRWRHSAASAPLQGGPGNLGPRTTLSQAARPHSSVTPAPCLGLRGRGKAFSAGLLNSLVKTTFHPTHHSRINLKNNNKKK